MKSERPTSGKQAGGFFFQSWRSWRSWPQILAAALVVAALAAALVVAITRRAPAPRAVDYTEMVRQAEGHAARTVRVDGERIMVSTFRGEAIEAVVDDAAARHDLAARFAQAGVPVDFAPREEAPAARVAYAAVPLAVISALAIAGLFLSRRRAMRHVTSGGAGKGTLPVRFDDIAGMDEVKEALVETVEFLRDPSRFGRLGGRAPRGVLLTGAPGTGKTLLARAVATEAAVPFLSAPGSSFQEMFVGVGASRVRSLFAEARRLAPCIIFIDEIDAVGRARGKGEGAAASDHDQTLNQLLVEMDGFDPRSGIVIIASTNRPDILDPAVVRPGRFDRQLVVPLPDLRGRQQILEVHARPLDLGAEVDLSRVARGTPGFSGADLANLLNEAAILAARAGASAVSPSHVDEARDRALMGLERRGFLLDEEERHATAVHEAGHVAVGVVAAHADPIYKVSILPRGRSLGVTHSLPERDRWMLRREYLEDQVCMLLGGRAAEIEILGTMTSGAADDLSRATSLSRRMVTELGMSDLGPICLADAASPHSQALLHRAEEATLTLLSAQLARARRIVSERRGEIALLVERLLERDTLSAEDIWSCFPADRRAAA